MGEPDVTVVVGLADAAGEACVGRGAAVVVGGSVSTGGVCPGGTSAGSINKPYDASNVDPLAAVWRAVTRYWSGIWAAMNKKVNVPLSLTWTEEFKTVPLSMIVTTEQSGEPQKSLPYTVTRWPEPTVDGTN